MVIVHYIPGFFFYQIDPLKGNSPTPRLAESGSCFSFTNISANSKAKSERLEMCKGSMRSQFMQKPRKSASLPCPFNNKSLSCYPLSLRKLSVWSAAWKELKSSTAMTTRIPCGWYVDTMFSTDMSPAWLYNTLLDSLNTTSGGQRMQLHVHTGAEHFGNVIFRHSELTSQYHYDASLDVNRMCRARDKPIVSQSGTVAEQNNFKR
jgi:hypothetical protein